MPSAGLREWDLDLGVWTWDVRLGTRDLRQRVRGGNAALELWVGVCLSANPTENDSSALFTNDPRIQGENVSHMPLASTDLHPPLASWPIAFGFPGPKSLAPVPLSPRLRVGQSLATTIGALSYNVPSPMRRSTTGSSNSNWRVT